LSFSGLLCTIGQKVGDISRYVDINDDGSVDACASRQDDISPIQRHERDTAAFIMDLIEALGNSALEEVEAFLRSEGSKGESSLPSFDIALESLGESSEHKSEIPSLRAVDTLVKVKLYYCASLALSPSYFQYCYP